VIGPFIKNIGSVINPRDVVNDTFDVFAREITTSADTGSNEKPFGHFNSPTRASDKPLYGAVDEEHINLD
jgi:hypothetical protein